MKGISRLWIAALTLVCAAGAASAQTTIRLASPAPLGSVWHKALKQFEADIKTATGGRVVLRVIGAAQDDEATMISNMKIGRQHAASITALGLASVDPAFNIFSIPMFFSSYDEYRTVRAKIEPTLKAKLEAKGLVLLNWGDTGWVYLFSKTAVPNVEVLKKQRLYTSAGEDAFVQLYKQNGFNPRPLPFTEIQSGLMTGLLDAVPSTPLATLAFQWYRNVPEMLDMGVGPLAGGTVVDAKVWNAIDANDRQQILTIARKMQDTLDRDVPQQDETAKAEMVKRGLKLTKPDAAATKGFRDMADKFAVSMKGGVVPADIYDLATRERDAFRKSRGTK
ncbi:MAG: TRAP transporter substrate-binding protein DctP [Acidobacteria bacterium]|nr:TRAP transporter substrate-binding protein DctP [Acidobacteriota bacterium]